MKKRWYATGSVLLALCLGTVSFAATPSYLTQSEYSDLLFDNYTEDRGIVVENYPELGYLVYKNNKGQLITRSYYSAEVEVEKQPYYEEEDRIGYLDELFPNFSYDPRDTTMAGIQAGDCIYIRVNAEGNIFYVSAYNDYMMRYGKVVSFNYNSGEAVSLQLQDEKGGLYYYEIPINTPVTKGKKSCALSTVKAGDWVKVLVCQKILGEGIIEETALEIVIDNDTRVISNVYRGQVTSLDSYKQLLNIKNAQALGNKNWGSYNELQRLSIDERTAAIYQNSSRVSADYLRRYLINSDGYVYIAAENYKGKENAVKLNFQGKYQTTLAPDTVIASSLNTVKLLSGQSLNIGADSIIVRDNRLVDAGSIMVGDKLQAVMTAENKLAVGIVSNGEPAGSLSVYRGRIKKIDDHESFQVETFSILEDNTWYYHPTPQTLTIDATTKFYNDTGMAADGITTFLSYGAETHIGDVYTIIANGSQAQYVISMPYVKESVKGEVYAADGTAISIKDAYYYDTTAKKWIEYSKKNIGATITLSANAVIIKEGKVIPAAKLEAGDVIRVMTETNLKSSNGTAAGYILVVEK